MSRKIRLYDYQEEMLSRIGKAFLTHRSVMAQMPTGTGKTVLLAGYLARSAEERVLIVAHRRELVEQIEETVGRLFRENGTDARTEERVCVHSIQWLARHYDDIAPQPSLVVVDEAHHALASTYKEMWRRFPAARFLGLTATPCRLNRQGFTDLFDVLVTSRSVAGFIRSGRLSPFDYVSIRPDSKEQLLVDSLKQRGTDGDYQLKEMDAKLNRRPGIERLHRSVVRYAERRKGIVYAVSISHARNIAAYYRTQGLNAVAIDSRTPAAVRRDYVERFRRNELEVLVNVDIFSEGFDCPDVEFVQIARPTLSLAKYLQMVGRGLRVSAGKKACVIIDNVGLYKVFGLPTQRWDWQAMFAGKSAGPDAALLSGVAARLRALSLSAIPRDTSAAGEESMVMVADHKTLLARLEEDAKATGLRHEWQDLLAGRLGECRRLGAQLVELRRPDGSICFVDLKNMNKIEAGFRPAEYPVVRRYGKFELVSYRDAIYTRTLRPYVYERFPHCNEHIHNHGFYLEIITGETKSVCNTFPPQVRTKGRASVTLCLLEGDGDTYYFLSCRLTNDEIVVMKPGGLYYRVTRNGRKELIARSRPESEAEDFNIVVPRLFAARHKKADARIVRPDAQNALPAARPEGLEPYQAGSKWGLREKESRRIVLPPTLRRIVPAATDLFLFEQNPQQWGILRGPRPIVEAKYISIEVLGSHKARGMKIPGKWEELAL